MKLATRFSAYFLTALAAVLIGFSASLFGLASTHLRRQVEERMIRALDTLEASVDIERQGLEWEPTDRRITLGMDLGPDEVRWAVRDGGGALVDRSANAGRGGFRTNWKGKVWPTNPSDGTVFGDEPGWRMAARRMKLDDLLRQGRGHPDDEPGYEVQYSELILVVGLSPAPVTATLNRLAITLIALSTAIWLLAAAGGRLLARGALMPVSRMAEGVAAMSASDLGRHLPSPGTGDELEALARAFNDLLDRLHEGFERQRLFAGDASHQLRTPLAALLGQVELALRRQRTPEEYRGVLERVHAEGVRLRDLVESMLFLAQPDAAGLPLSELDVAEWLPWHMARWSEHARGGDVRVEVDGSQPLHVRVHAAMLAQLVDNLVDNACKYSPAGTPIVVKVDGDGAAVVLAVEDRGLGLASEDAARVFTPFFRAEAARRAGQSGSGLGLAVARQIAAAFHGRLVVESEPGCGCRFVLRLPRSIPTNAQAVPTGTGQCLA